jgi:cobalt-zinc-cadmium efflux system membrane fusion protein
VKKNIGDEVKCGEVLAVLESNESLSRYELKAMIDGVIISKHIALGESLPTDQVVYIIADLSSVWIDLTLYQKDLLVVRKGQSSLISGGIHLPTAGGTIDYISPTLDEHTRTGHARVVLPNPRGEWKPGMFVSALVNTGSKDVGVAVPESALIMLHGSPSVFIRDEDGIEPRAVKTGRVGGGMVEVTEGLKAGEVYAARGVFTLKAELGRGEMSSGHSH